MYEVAVEHVFAAGHALRNYRGGCENIHGHNFRVEVVFQGEELDSAGLLVDFVEVQKLIADVVSRLDHVFINEVPPFDVLNPSVENMARYFHEEIARELAKGKRENQVRVAQVTVWETDVARAVYRS
ncbi:MAG: 6-carboxytetrahydropterin synthase QueD [Bryobacteraceae bacterium]|nr:6-carboxytetrahydropterin synthase QueD [Bryobacteraceae bacterium]